MQLEFLGAVLSPEHFRMQFKSGLGCDLFLHRLAEAQRLLLLYFSLTSPARHATPNTFISFSVENGMLEIRLVFLWRVGCMLYEQVMGAVGIFIHNLLHSRWVDNQHPITQTLGATGLRVTSP